MSALLAVLTLTLALLAPQAAHAFGPLGEDLRVSSMGPDRSASYQGRSSSVAYSPAANEYLVVWFGDDHTAPLVDNEFEIFAQRVSASGAALGGRIRVSDMGPDGNAAYRALRPSVAYNAADNEYLVTWEGDDNTAPLVDDESEIFGQRLTTAGTQTGANDFRISDMGPDGNADYDALRPSVVYNAADNEYLVIWEGDDNTAPLVDEEFEIFGQRLTAAGTEAGANDFRVSDTGPDGNTNFAAGSPSVAYNSGDNQFLVTWYGDDAVAPLVDDELEIFGQRLTAAGTETGANDFRVSDMGANGTTSFAAASPSVAYSSVDNQFLVTWHGDDAAAPLVNNELEIFGQRLDRTGTQQGANDFRISDMGPDETTSYAALEPSVAYSSTRNQFLVTWFGDDNTAPLRDEAYEIFGQRLDGAGTQEGANDFRISEMGPDDDTAYGGFDPSVAYNSANDHYLVAWHGSDADATAKNEVEVFGRRLGEPPPPDAGTAPGGGTPSGGAPGGGTSDGGPTPADTLAPRFSRLALSPTAFAALPSGASVRGARARGTRITYRLTEAATGTFRVQRALTGRRVRGRCVRPTRGNRGKRRCTRYRTLRGSFSHAGTAGRNRFGFSGRLAGRKLPPGNYRLVAVPTDAAGNRGVAARTPFRIVR